MRRFVSHFLLAAALLVSGFLAVPQIVSAAPACYCQTRHLGGDPCDFYLGVKLTNRINYIAGRWYPTGAAIANQADCQDECAGHLQGSAYYGNPGGPGAAACTATIGFDGRCAPEASPNDPICGTQQYCLCAFKPGTTQSSGYQNVSCAGRFWYNSNGNDRGSAGATRCASACGTYLGTTAVSGQDYVSTASLPSQCYYDRSGDSCDGSGEANGISNYGSSYLNLCAQNCPGSADPAACQANCQASQCKPRWCYCRYPGSFAVESCRAKTVFVGGAVSDAVCSTICQSKSLEFSQSYDSPDGGCSYLDSSLFTVDPASDHCAKPAQDRPSCEAAEAAHAALNSAQNAAREELRRGSVLGLNLPLSNISPPALIGRVIRQLLSIVGALTLAYFVWGGVSWMLARGNQEEVAKAKKMITAAASGLIAIFAAYAVLSLILNTLSR